MSTPPTPRQTSRITKTQACDACKKRKTKCDRENPCDRCLEAGIVCTYDVVPLRKGRSGRKARVLSSLRAAPTSGDSTSPTSHEEIPEHPMPSHAYISSPLNPISPVPFLLFEPSQWSPMIANTQMGGGTESAPMEPILECQKSSDRIPSVVLTAHAHVFLKHLYPIMPVVDPHELLHDCIDPDSLSAQNYAFIAALCAMTHIQLSLDYPESPESPSATTPLNASQTKITGNQFLSEVLRMRQDFDILDDPDCITLLTSFFLFAAYGNLNKQKRALFYIHQAISFAFMLGLHEESTYAELIPAEAEKRRKIFWLLFISERAYSLQLSKPVLLSPSIRKPEIFSSSNPRLLFGFLNLIRLFEKLKPSLYQKSSASRVATNAESEGTEPVWKICNDIATFEPPVDEIVETQKVDIMVTRDWLQIMLCQRASQDQDPSRLSLDMLSCAKSVIGTVSLASQDCVSAHGIGMEQKLYDIASSTARALASMSLATMDMAAGAVVDPRDLIWEYVRVLSHIRGNPSYLLPDLLKCSDTLLGLSTPMISPELSITWDSINSFIPTENIEKDATQFEPLQDLLENY